MTIVQTLSSEKGNIIEKRHEMILAHEKFGVKIENITAEYGISIGTYYYWYNKCILFINHGNSLCYEELCFANRVLETCVKFIIFCLCKVYHYF
jgi:hypothetical protein